MNKSKHYIKNYTNPFECMSSEARYWIGYILADGHLVFNELIRAYQISLFSKDEDIVNKFRQFIGPKARFYKRSTGIYQVVYNSKPVTKWFMDTFQVPQNKSQTLNPNLILDWDIIHGYFDGDGCIRLIGTHYECKFTTGSKVWAERIQKFLQENEIESVVTKKGNAFDVNIYKKSSVALLFIKMYANNTSKLEYKYNRLVALFGNK